MNDQLTAGLVLLIAGAIISGLGFIGKRIISRQLPDPETPAPEGAPESSLTLAQAYALAQGDLIAGTKRRDAEIAHLRGQLTLAWRYIRALLAVIAGLNGTATPPERPEGLDPHD